MQPMSADPDFALDLYHGAADYYDRFRLTYSQVLLDELLSRAEASGRGRLMDLACGTGQLAFALHGAFAETWAVDQEPGMIRVVEAKAARDGIAMRATTSSAEEFPAEDGGFELITIGNAFHRLRVPPASRCGSVRPAARSSGGRPDRAAWKPWD
jgi:ubiquinone/menaquinone biosynthesis C-methylase UbiE